MGKSKDLSEFETRDKLLIAKQPGQSISKTAASSGCSWSAVVSIYQSCPSATEASEEVLCK